MRLAWSCLACLTGSVSWLCKADVEHGAAAETIPSNNDVVLVRDVDDDRVAVNALNSSRGETHNMSACRASWPIFSISSLLRRGLMVLASPSSYSSSLSSMLGLSRGIMMVPLDFLLPRRGRGCRAGSPFAWSCSLTEEPDEVVDMSSGYDERRVSCSTTDGYGVKVTWDWSDISTCVRLWGCRVGRC